jgi:hypothetical protein
VEGEEFREGEEIRSVCFSRQTYKGIVIKTHCCMRVVKGCEVVVYFIDYVLD